MSLFSLKTNSIVTYLIFHTIPFFFLYCLFFILLYMHIMQLDYPTGYELSLTPGEITTEYETEDRDSLYPLI